MKKNSAKKEIRETKSTTQRGVTGTVVSTKMAKTIVVQVMRLVKHPLYGKYMRHYSKMYVHDAENQCRDGDVVKIEQTRPISKSKRWKLVEVVRRAEQADAVEAN
jgi:small subunit ribosomal protein S17